MSQMEVCLGQVGAGADCSLRRTKLASGERCVSGSVAVN